MVQTVIIELQCTNWWISNTSVPFSKCWHSNWNIVI